MTQPYYRRTTCRLCEESSLETVLEFPDSPVGDAYVPEKALESRHYPLALVRCSKCGLLQLPDVVAPEILYGNYLYFTGISLGLPEHFQVYANAVLKQVAPPAQALVIDIGSNDGTLLRCFKERGMRVLGIDPAAEVAKMATERGVETVIAYFDPSVARKVREERGPAAIVTANNVLANIDDVPGVIKGVRELLAPDGVFVFETGYMPDLIQKTILDNVYHEHISYYSVAPLDSFFKSHGMQLVDVRHVPTKGGSIRGVVQLAGGPRPVSPRVTDMIRLEQILGYTEPAPFQAFAARAATVRGQMLSLLTSLKAEGKSIAGYGASVGVTTLIYYFGLAPFLDFLVDDNATRHHLYSPGHNLQVLPSETLNQARPDYVVLLPWQYSAPIIKRHQSYLDAGGQFIILLPEPQLA